MRALIAGLCALPLSAAASPGYDVSATVSGLRSTKGQVIACLTADPEAFPNCDKDPGAIGLTMPASEEVLLDFGQVAAGRYAIAIIHDENTNGKMDKALMMPREGFGFSRNAKLRLGPPSFEAASFPVEGASKHQSIRMRYIF